MGKLTTHVLDTANGCPAAGVKIHLYRCANDGTRTLIKTATTNHDGRCDQPLLTDVELEVGSWELVFHMGAYFWSKGNPNTVSEPPFLDLIPILFGVADPHAHYHVPLLASPWSYSTYRGS
ncbi:5-hydroxyisourate hydrolase [Thiothrix eikelboomii]|uniref:5-hydroxyisourate hydrolase n=1 Tax=Thiothrix eikelboomii TaxID=92487 RepID=A0A1T4X1B0_9GAMM|nr:hydroxyisourate hydrolase [Thiothrix eikelboomii]SKA83372.1 5-hydroxyisourate hydrolase [Thiothrix eikelboomii]